MFSPIKIFIIGIGSLLLFTPPKYLYNGNCKEFDAAFATARETPSVAFAPKIDLFSVVSSFTNNSSILFCS